MLEIDKIFLAIMIIDEDLSPAAHSSHSLRNYSPARTSAAPPFFDLVARLVAPGDKININISGRDFLRPVRESGPRRSLSRYYVTKVARINQSRKGSTIMSCKFFIKRSMFETVSHTHAMIAGDRFASLLPETRTTSLSFN